MNKAVIFAARICLLGCAAPVSTLHAQDDAPAGWSGEAEFGFVITGGNTETETVNAKFKLINDDAPWKHTGKLDVLNGSDSGETNADRISASGKSDLDLDESSYIFGLLSYEDDRFSGYDYQVSETVGYGWRLLQDDAMILNTEAGLGARQSRLSDDGEDERDGIVRLAVQFEWSPGETAKLTEDLNSETGGGLTVTRSLTALSAQIVGNLLAKFSIRITHTSDVPPGIDTTDTETSTTLVYEF